MTGRERERGRERGREGGRENQNRRSGRTLEYVDMGAEVGIRGEGDGCGASPTQPVLLAG